MRGHSITFYHFPFTLTSLQKHPFSHNFPTYYCTISQARTKMKLLLTSLLLCLLLQPQPGCEAATVWCTGKCKKLVEEAESISGQEPDYRAFLIYKYTKFSTSECRPCMPHYCELIDGSYGTAVAEEVCNYVFGK